MSDELLSERRRALEDEFFRRQDEALISRLRSEQKRTEARAALKDATGITDAKLLDELLDADVCASGIAAFALVPLVEVAWADGKLDPNERAAILSSAEKEGLVSGTAGHRMLQTWLDSPTAPSLLRAWLDYTKTLCRGMSDDSKAKLHSRVIGRARAVAEAAGGLLGIGAISSEEHEVLRLLESAFTDS